MGRSWVWEMVMEFRRVAFALTMRASHSAVYDGWDQTVGEVSGRGE